MLCRPVRYRRGLIASLLCLVLLPAPGRAEEPVVTPIAVSGQASPIGGSYILFGDVSIDGLGGVTFTASLTNGKVVVFRRSSCGVLEPLVTRGDPAPLDFGGTFNILFEASSNSAGDLAFLADNQQTGLRGVFRREGGVITTVAREFDPAPIPSGGFFTGFDQVYLLGSGEIYFGGSVQTSAGEPSRAVIKSTTSGLEPVVAPGDRFGGIKEVAEALQFEVNQSGDVAVLAIVTDSASLTEDQFASEILLFSGGVLQSLALENGPAEGPTEIFLHFAETFDQVNIEDAGVVAFFASTNDAALGAYFVNQTGEILANTKILKQGDPTPLSASDTFRSLRGFGLNMFDTLVFHATTDQSPAGGLFARRGGDLVSVAQVGEPRPDGLDVWNGFLRVEVNNQDDFVFTDFQGLVQSGVFLGEFVPSPIAPGEVEDLDVELVNGGEDLLFTWTDTQGADDYVLFEDDSPAGPFDTVVGAALSGSTGLTVSVPGTDKFYLVAGRDAACGLGPRR